MEIRIIDSQPFIVVKEGKRETVRTLADFKATQEAEVFLDESAIDDLKQAEQRAQRSLESAVLAGLSSSQAREQLQAIADEVKGHHAAISQARASIKQAEQLVDTYRTTLMRQASQAETAALVKPFEEFLEKHHVAK